MSAHADASEAGRLLAAKRWDPETRLREAVDTVVRRSADLDAAQLAELRAVAGKQEGGSGE